MYDYPKKRAYIDLTENKPDGVNFHLNVSSSVDKEIGIDFSTKLSQSVHLLPVKDRLNSKLIGGALDNTSATRAYNWWTYCKKRITDVEHITFQSWCTFDMLSFLDRC